jgi:putative MATE family efflux protein
MAQFTTGSTLRHVAVMTATGSVGLVAVFAVDFLNLFYIALLGQQELAAAVGYAGTILFFLISVNIGSLIAASALTARALGAGDRAAARRLASTNLVIGIAAASLIAAVLMPFLGAAVGGLGATGRTRDIAVDFLVIVVPSTPIFTFGIIATGLLRAVADPRRSMYVTLGAAFATAVFDPILIFGFGWGVEGAAVANVISRFAMLGIGWHALVRVHDLLARPTLADCLEDARPIADIAVPAMLTNIATPVGNAWVTSAVAAYGDAAVAGFAVIGRITPLAFGGIYALSGAVGPILGQNYGAGRFDRLRRAVGDSLLFALGYTFVVWLLLALLAHPIVALFGMAGEAGDLVVFFCRVVAGTFVFTAALFVGNAVFNNLGMPTLSTVFNWARATAGTIPFVWAGGKLGGAEGVILGHGLGGVVFGIAAVIACYRAVDRLAAAPRPEAAARAAPMSANPDTVT